MGIEFAAVVGWEPAFGRELGALLEILARYLFAADPNLAGGTGRDFGAFVVSNRDLERRKWLPNRCQPTLD